MPSTYAGHLTDPPRDRRGRPIPNVTFELYLPGTTTRPTYYTNRLKSGTVQGPPSTDEFGNCDWWPEPGVYDYWYEGEFIQTITVTEDNSEDDAALTAAINTINALLAADYYTKTQVDELVSVEAGELPQLLSGNGAPAGSLGVDGSWYIDRVAKVLYGPKGGGVWPSLTTSLIGQKGDPGDPGVNLPYLGVWDADTAYTADQSVAHDGLLWVSIQANTGIEPVEGSAYWTNITKEGPAGDPGTNDLNTSLRAWAASGAYQMTTPTYHATYDLVQSAVVTWPDGSGGTYTATTVDATHQTTNAYTITHSNSGKTVTQTAVTRDTYGRITNEPTLTVAP